MPEFLDEMGGIASLGELLHRLPVAELVSLFTEQQDEDICFVGKVIEMDADFLLLQEYGTMSELCRHELTLPIAAITRIEIGSEYLRDLEIVFDKLS